MKNVMKKFEFEVKRRKHIRRNGASRNLFDVSDAVLFHLATLLWLLR